MTPDGMVSHTAWHSAQKHQYGRERECEVRLRKSTKLVAVVRPPPQVQPAVLVPQSVQDGDGLQGSRAHAG